jgi:glycosyltransferase involved in cell wall biosynthesis
VFDIVIALYNKARFIERTIESVLAQNCPDWRLFVVDDGSTDDGPDRVARFTDPRITLIRQKNAGVGPARNAGIAAGSAPWIAFLDADDLWASDHLAELDKVRRTYPDALLIGTRFSSDPLRGSAKRGQTRVSRYFHEAATGRPPLITSSAAVSREALDSWGRFGALNGNEDVELWARLAVHGPVAVSTKRMVFYRRDTGGITDQRQSASIGPMRREDMSSTIPTLDELLPTITDPQLRRDVLEYVDSRIGVHLIQAVRYGHIRYARHCRTLMTGTPKGKARIAAALASLPPFVTRSIIATFIATKRAGQRLLQRAQGSPNHGPPAVSHRRARG